MPAKHFENGKKFAGVFSVDKGGCSITLKPLSGDSPAKYSRSERNHYSRAGFLICGISPIFSRFL
jgi:hypothetical protein